MFGEIMENLVIVRGGGDIATGTIYKLYKCGFKVLILEIPNPSAIRRHVAFSEAVYQGEQTVEDVTCVLAKNVEEAKELLNQGKLVLLVDPEGASIKELKPLAVVDGILAKKNLGTTKEMADITIALGPGFVAGADEVGEIATDTAADVETGARNGNMGIAKADVHAVVETMRGHSLGRIIYQGSAIPNTGVPGKIGGYDKERVIHSPAEGILRNTKKIGDDVRKNDIIAVIEQGEERIPVLATIDGFLRGLIRDGYPVTKGFKIADIDPRMQEKGNCYTISDKARCIAGGVLEAILYLRGQK